MKNTKKTISKVTTDLSESFDDKKHLQPDEAILDLPDVRDIPGQEHIHVPELKEYADTTISSDDEEGLGIFDDEDKMSNESNVTKEEKKALSDAAEKTIDLTDEKTLEQAQLDNTDDEGDLLNERTDVSGSDLDVPGSEDDDDNENVGEEDEENNSYSLDRQDEHDSVSKQ